MSKSEQTLIDSLRSSEIHLRQDISSLRDLTTADLASICRQSLTLIGDAASFRTAKSMAGSELASAMKRIGYPGDVSSDQFLCPSEDASRELIRFLLGKVSGSFGVGGRNGQLESLGDRRGDDGSVRIEAGMMSDLGAKSGESSINERNAGSSEDRASKTRYEDEDSGVERELGLLEAAVELVFDERHPVEYHLERLNKEVDTKRHSLRELSSQWEATRKPLEEERKRLGKLLYGNRRETREKFERLEEIELETRAVLAEVESRKEELSRVSEQLEKQPKGALSRKSHIDRVKEITKNSRKQDADIERILTDTRELQLESNAVQERLHRTYAVVDEMVFREAKKDSVGRQAYRLVTSVHECFEQIAETIMATDRVRREVAEREKKLASMASRSLNVDKLDADLDATRTENERVTVKIDKDTG